MVSKLVPSFSVLFDKSIDDFLLDVSILLYDII